MVKLPMEEIDPRHLLIKVAGILEKLNIPYAVTGGMAVFVWGRPRFTADVDIIVLFKSKDIDLLAGALEKLSRASYVSKEAMYKASEGHGEFNFIDGASGVKVDFWVLGRRRFDTEQLNRRVAKQVLGKTIYFVSPEDLILNKLLWNKKSGSSRQLEDIESVIKIQNTLNWKYMKKWAKQQSTFQILQLLPKKGK